jgi:hypothetical protein
VRCPHHALAELVPVPLAIQIFDAVASGTVTRKTLLRYTFKSRGVNILVCGKVWKTLGRFWARVWGGSNHAIGCGKMEKVQIRQSKRAGQNFGTAP